MSINQLGLVLHRLRFSETSLILSLLTNDSGLLEVIAKGACRPKTPLTGRLDLFHLEEVTLILPKRTDALATATESVLCDEFTAIRSNPAAFAVAAVAAETILHGCPRRVPRPEMFCLATAAWQQLAADCGELRNSLLPTRLLWQILGILGYVPGLRRCGVCRKLLLETGRFEINIVPHTNRLQIICNRCQRQARWPVQLRSILWQPFNWQPSWHIPVVYSQEILDYNQDNLADNIDIDPSLPEKLLNPDAQRQFFFHLATLSETVLQRRLRSYSVAIGLWNNK